MTDWTSFIPSWGGDNTYLNTEGNNAGNTSWWGGGEGASKKAEPGALHNLLSWITPASSSGPLKPVSAVKTKPKAFIQPSLSLSGTEMQPSLEITAFPPSRKMSQVQSRQPAKHLPKLPPKSSISVVPRSGDGGSGRPEMYKLPPLPQKQGQMMVPPPPPPWWRSRDERLKTKKSFLKAKIKVKVKVKRKRQHLPMPTLSGAVARKQSPSALSSLLGHGPGIESQSMEIRAASFTSSPGAIMSPVPAAEKSISVPCIGGHPIQSLSAIESNVPPPPPFLHTHTDTSTLSDRMVNYVENVLSPSNDVPAHEGPTIDQIGRQMLEERRPLAPAKEAQTPSAQPKEIVERFSKSRTLSIYIPASQAPESSQIPSIHFHHPPFRASHFVEERAVELTLASTAQTQPTADETELLNPTLPAPLVRSKYVGDLDRGLSIAIMER